MGISKPGGLNIEPNRKLCPICGKASYSSSGTHPQCEVAKSDTAFRAALKARIAAGEVPAVRHPWTTRCPRCGLSQPSRRFACDCGYSFVPQSAPASTLPMTNSESTRNTPSNQKESS